MSSSQSSSSFYEPPRKPIDKKVFYHNIKMNMQEIQRVAHEVDKNMKKVREDVDITATLLNAIEIHAQQNKN
ncbi:hypothetical protein V1477_012576 [Vespula maculifrons]|uniref:Uncharacterized protein n=3 Tax=Vespula TaxID=7451 RepID=A0A834JVK3_VESGE|nr:hypothetical protein HZH68_009533 [Vespula germanica]KAF7420524.1 hypothetical protein H0235_010821 [Vespula pensylvanica]